jgi:hypothetical protein
MGGGRNTAILLAETKRYESLVGRKGRNLFLDEFMCKMTHLKKFTNKLSGRKQKCVSSTSGPQVLPSAFPPAKKKSCGDICQGFTVE